MAAKHKNREKRNTDFYSFLLYQFAGRGAVKSFDFCCSYITNLYDQQTIISFKQANRIGDGFKYVHLHYTSGKNKRYPDEALTFPEKVLVAQQSLILHLNLLSFLVQ